MAETRREMEAMRTMLSTPNAVTNNLFIPSSFTQGGACQTQGMQLQHQQPQSGADYAFHAYPEVEGPGSAPPMVKGH